MPWYEITFERMAITFVLIQADDPAQAEVQAGSLDLSEAVWESYTPTIGLMLEVSEPEEPPR